MTNPIGPQRDVEAARRAMADALTMGDVLIMANGVVCAPIADENDILAARDLVLVGAATKLQTKGGE